MPCGEGVERGVVYRFQLLTHCGIEWAYFDGRYWVPARPVDPHPKWNPVERGTMILRGRNDALFNSDPERPVRFVPAPERFRPQICA